MPIRSQTKRRVLIVLSVVVLLVGAGGLVYFLSARREAAQVARLRQDGMAAYQAGEYGRSVKLLGQYIDKARAQHTDPDALFAYGRSRMVHEPTLRHLLESVKVFETYERLRPGDGEARHLLLQLYPRVGYNEEALKIADDLLAKDPADRSALRTKAQIYYHQAQRAGGRSLEDVLKVCEELNRVAPDDLAGQFLTQYVLVDLKTDPQEILKRYEALQQAKPGDARFEVLLAEAQHVAGQDDKARETLKAAAGHAGNDLDLVPQLVQTLDRLRMFGESLALLEASAAAIDRPEAKVKAELMRDGTDPRAWVRRTLAQRLWQLGRYKDVADRFAAAPASEPSLLGYRALSLYALDRGAEGAALADALAKREEDPTAAAWAKAIRANAAQPPLPPAERVKAFQAALDDDADVPVIHYLLGEAYNAQGETELAIGAWRKAAERAPSWALPAAMVGRAYNATGRGADALTASREAALRAPTVANTAAYLNARFSALGESGDADKAGEAQKLLDDVRRFREQAPADAETLHVEVALLARTGKPDEAQARARAILEANPPPPLSTFLSLAAVSYAEKLGLESDVLTAAERAHGPNPEVALRRAMLMHEAGQTADGLALLQGNRQKAAGSPSEPAWGVAVARYLDAVRGPAAPAEWAALGDRYANDLAVQTAVLRSPSRMADREFWRRTLDRTKALTGEQGMTYRLERARWLLAAPNMSEKEVSEAIDLLSRIVESSPNLADTRWLLAGAYERLASFKQGKDRENFQNLAVDELKAAFNLRPADPALAQDLSRMLRAVGKPEETRQVMERLAGASARTPEQRQRVARTLAAEGRLDEAINLLQSVGDGKDPARDALLADLYRRTGRTHEAADLYAALLTADRPEPGALTSAASFFAAKGQPEQAQKFLDKLAALPLRAGELELYKARYAETNAGSEEALKHYTAATQAQGAGAEAWRALADFQLRSRRFAAAAAAAEQGLKAAPNDAELLSLRTRAQALESYRNDPNLESLAAALDDDPRSAATAEMLKVLAAARAANEPPERTVEKLRALAGQHPTALSLQGHVFHSYLTLGRWRDAVDVAAKAAAANPNHPDPARWLVAAQYAARDWDQALQAARQWRQRTLEAPLDADLAIAQTLLRMRPPRAQEALDQLKPHLERATTGGGNVAVASTYAQGLIVLRREGEAAKLLRPQAESQPQWRLAWLNLAPVAFQDADAATRWVEQVVPLIPADAARERLVLADVWYEVGTTLHAKPAIEKARQALAPLVAKPDAAPAAWRQWAVVAAALGDLDEAERGYRKLLAAQPKLAEVQNNLAYVLLTRGRPQDLSEARALAEGAIANEPRNATFYDTLARVQVAAGDRESATQTFRKAIERDGRNVEALIGLADLLTRAGEADEARRVLGQIETVLNEQGGRQAATPLPLAVQKQLEAVRSAVRESAKAPLESGSIE